jgi:RNA polymerase subunit RPABC4/transcription elongation factor Spt4
MTKYDTLYVCPICTSEHTADEWNDATEDDFGGNIMPIEIAEPDCRYTCPTCSNVTDVGALTEK